MTLAIPCGERQKPPMSTVQNTLPARQNEGLIVIISNSSSAS